MDQRAQRIAVGTTASTADAFVRRSALWSRLLDLFREHRPTEDQLAQVSTIAEVAIDRVFTDHRLTEEQREERHAGVKDFAACAGLYAWVLGYHQGLEAERPSEYAARLRERCETQEAELVRLRTELGVLKNGRP